MEDSNKIILTPKEEWDIVELAKSTRRKLDLGMGVLGEKIFKVFRDNDIILFYFKLNSKDAESLAAFYLEKYSSVTDITSYYIAVNSLVPLDLQIFNACHEFYHHLDDKKDKLHINRLCNPDDSLISAKANRFAAEFLLPTETLKAFVKKYNRGEVDLENWTIQAILRLITQLQIDYQVPYRMIVKRLKEIDAIKSELREKLLEINERDIDSIYYKIGSAVNNQLFDKLNSVSDKKGVESEALNVILQNFDEDTITLDVVVDDLKIFNKKIEDFGYDIDIDDDDIDEIKDLFGDDK